jgi:predicted short-subunit dehydrogenase-like oxidoreductase (DUF2520 family)
MGRPGLEIAIVGAGNLARVLAISLHRAGYRVSQIVSRSAISSRRRAAALARRTSSQTTTLESIRLDFDLLWICVPDDNIRACAQALADKRDWQGKIVLHTSGALSSDELKPLKSRGAATGSVHPMNTFVAASRTSMKGVPFAAEGDVKALKAVRPLIHALGGELFTIPKRNKALYHATGSLSSPLLVALLATAMQTARASGVNKPASLLEPIVRQTVNNFFSLGAADAFSGPLRRGDLETIRRHLKELRKLPQVREVYVALAKQAAEACPVKRRSELMKLLK